MSNRIGPEAPRWLHSLPTFEPSGALWPRVVEARAARARRRRAFGFAAAAGLLITFGVGFLVGRVDRAPHLASVEQSRSQALEAELATARAAEPADGAIAIQAQLVRLDGELQGAVDRRADETELRALWRARGELEVALLAAYQRPSDLVRL